MNSISPNPQAPIDTTKSSSTTNSTSDKDTQSFSSFLSRSTKVVSVLAGVEIGKATGAYLGYTYAPMLCKALANWTISSHIPFAREFMAYRLLYQVGPSIIEYTTLGCTGGVAYMANKLHDPAISLADSIKQKINPTVTTPKAEQCNYTDNLLLEDINSEQLDKIEKNSTSDTINKRFSNLFLQHPDALKTYKKLMASISKNDQAILETHIKKPIDELSDTQHKLLIELVSCLLRDSSNEIKQQKILKDYLNEIHPISFFDDFVNINLLVDAKA